MNIKTTWKNIKTYFSDVNSEYRLASKPLPELNKLKSVHQDLIQAYAGSLAAVSRLTFFIRGSEVQLAKEGRVRAFLRKLAWVSLSPLRLIIWRPVVSFYVQAHIYSKMKELESTYTVASFLPSINPFEEKKLRDWLLDAKKDCQQLLSVVSAGKILWNAVNLLWFAVINILVAAWGANNLFDLILKLPVSSPTAEVQVAIGRIGAFLLIALPLTAIFVEFAFFVKRSVFQNINHHTGNRETIYQLENQLFDLLGIAKTKEIPVDFVAHSIIYFTFLLSLRATFQITITEAANPTNPQVFDLSWTFQALLLAMFVFDVVIPWYERARKGDM
jgi:hypothetical protein